MMLISSAPPVSSAFYLELVDSLYVSKLQFVHLCVIGPATAHFWLSHQQQVVHRFLCLNRHCHCQCLVSTTFIFVVSAFAALTDWLGYPNTSTEDLSKDVRTSMSVAILCQAAQHCLLCLVVSIVWFCPPVFPEPSAYSAIKPFSLYLVSTPVGVHCR